MVEAVKVTKVYTPDVVALQEVSVSINKGEMVFLTGMSGAGKTTFLKLICCIERPTKGLIEVAGRDLSKITPSGIQRLRQNIGVAYQDFKILPQKTVLQNIAMSMEVLYKDTQEIRARVADLLDMLNLSDKQNTPAGKLSRGEQQRVAIARAAANKPPLLLADEPTGNLDREMSDRVVDLFLQLNREGTTVVVATHDEEIYKNKNYRILDLKHGFLTSLM
ncbi:MAG: cell division ATP-binding protein FtsE [Proteobacteria bacterium]|nr:cell division ATP-binding protein FtsE [Pseudomonadota bacterium]MBU1710546.1 cell division ATP-binding protein FtsE [Pseudomonadota bacterium]